jgi:hypothetical protein
MPLSNLDPQMALHYLPYSHFSNKNKHLSFFTNNICLLAAEENLAALFGSLFRG